MENEKSKLDEKTARLIEEMDKSLKSMEQAMGPDHMVVAKILDSYAKLLRQNNIRTLDAVNMEARAKHIRAKHNQQEEKAQTQALDDSVAVSRARKSGMTLGQAKAAVWTFAGIILCLLCYGAFEVLKSSSNTMVKTVKLKQHLHQEDPEAFYKAAPSPDGVPSPGEQAPELSGSSTGRPTNAVDQNAAQGSTGSPPPTRDPQEDAQEIAAAQNAQKVSAVKTFARQKVAEGLELEKNKDFAAAAQSYFAVINMAQQTSNSIGGPVYSESIAKAFEGYGRMAELDNHPDIAQQSEKAAADIRQHLGGDSDE